MLEIAFFLDLQKLQRNLEELPSALTFDLRFLRLGLLADCLQGFWVQGLVAVTLSDGLRGVHEYRGYVKGGELPHEPFFYPQSSAPHNAEAPCTAQTKPLQRRGLPYWCLPTCFRTPEALTLEIFNLPLGDLGYGNLSPKA